MINVSGISWNEIRVVSWNFSSDVTKTMGPDFMSYVSPKQFKIFVCSFNEVAARPCLAQQNFKQHETFMKWFHTTTLNRVQLDS